MTTTLIVAGFFALFPIIGLPAYFLLYIFDGKKNSWIYPLIIGLALGIISYYFVPKIGYDLIKHQTIIELFQNISFSDFLVYTKSLDLEFIPLLYTYIVAFFNNINLLQFFVVTAGYTILLYILYDYRKINKIDKASFSFLTIFIFFGFNTLYFISGLYCYIGIIIFLLGFYKEYVKNDNKAISYILYTLSLFTHSSLFLPVLLLVIYKLLGEKFDIKAIIISFLIFIFCFEIISVINEIFPNLIFSRILYMYDNYVSKNEHYKIYYSGAIFIIEISKLIVSLIFSLIDRKNKNNEKINNYIFLLSLSTVLMMIKARVAIRFIMLIQFISIIPIMSVLKKSEKKTRLFLTSIIALLGLMYLLHFINVFSNQSFGNFFINKYYNSIFRIF